MSLVDELRSQLSMSTTEVNRRNREEVKSKWQRRTNLCTAIDRFYQKMALEVENWDYKASPFYMERESHAYQMVLILVEFPSKKGSKRKTINLPVALYSVGYNARRGASVACKNHFIKILTSRKPDFRQLHWYDERVFEYWRLTYTQMLIAEGPEDDGQPETSAAARTRAADTGGASSSASSADSLPAGSSASSASYASSGDSLILPSGDAGEVYSDSDSYSDSYSDS